MDLAERDGEVAGELAIAARMLGPVDGDDELATDPSGGVDEVEVLTTKVAGVSTNSIGHKHRAYGLGSWPAKPNPRQPGA